jgi:hypothetical protein
MEASCMKKIFVFINTSALIDANPETLYAMNIIRMEREHIINSGFYSNPPDAKLYSLMIEFNSGIKSLIGISTDFDILYQVAYKLSEGNLPIFQRGISHEA